MIAAPGLYIHVPFCAHVCPYCDFAVQTGGPKKRSAYVDSLVREIGAWGARVGGDAQETVGPAPEVNQSEVSWACASPFDTVYIGGGTPSSLALDALETILAALFEALPIATDRIVTLETNPEDVTAANLADWHDLGINRLSLGVQSFDDDALGLLGRTHTSVDAIGALEAALGAAFDVVSLDLIYGVPGQSAENWRATLEQAVSLQPHHISCYELTLHEGTRFFDARRRGELVEVVDDAKADLFFDTHRFLAEAGCPAYEVSNFARGREYRSLHNAKYWDHTPYLGLGPSAHSFDGRGTRWWNERRLIDWQAALDESGWAVCEQETLTAEQLVLEALALGLRTTRGVDLDDIENRYGIDLRRDNAGFIESATRRGLLEPGAGAVLEPTLEGLALADALAAGFEIRDAAWSSGTPLGNPS